MLVLLYLEKIFIFTTSALLNPAAYFLSKTVWFTLTAVSITTSNFFYLHLVFWTGHIASIKSLWWFNRETVNIIYLGLKTSVVKKNTVGTNFSSTIPQLTHWAPLWQYSYLGTYQNCPQLTVLACPCLLQQLQYIVILLQNAQQSQPRISNRSWRFLGTSLAQLWLNGNSNEACWSRAKELRAQGGQCKSHQLYKCMGFYCTDKVY